MFCPKCRYEYNEHIKDCPSCEVPLVGELPQDKKVMSKPEYVELVTVLSTTDIGLVAVVKSFLEGADIKYFAKGEMLQGLYGIGNIGFNALSGPVEIQVRRDDAEDVMALLKDLKQGGKMMYIIDRFEGEWAVIEFNRKTFNLPRILVPPEVMEGDVLTIKVSVDAEATAKIKGDVKDIADNLFKD